MIALTSRNAFSYQATELLVMTSYVLPLLEITYSVYVWFQLDFLEKSPAVCVMKERIQATIWTLGERVNPPHT